MSKTEDFIKREKDHYGKVFVDLTYAIDNISPFLEKNQLSERKFITRLPALKRYIDLLGSTESELHKKSSFFSFLSDDSKYISLLESYKREHTETLTQLENCSRCVHRKSLDDKFDGCLGCRPGSRIVHYDNKMNVTFHDNYSINLVNDKTGREDRYKVLATLQNIERDTKYIIIQNFASGEKFVLHYFPGISEDTYGEIADAEEFDSVVSLFESVRE